VNAGFLQRIRTGRPLVTLKLATSLDGKIATRLGESQWITGAPARRFGHLLRRTHDAVLVGSGTVLADDPALSVRLAGLEAPPPLRIILDGRLRTPANGKLAASAASVPTIIVTAADADPGRRNELADAGIEVIDAVRAADGGLDLAVILHQMGARGVTRILVEGGAAVAASLLRERLVDRLAWFRSAGLIGGDGVSAVSAFGDGRLENQIRGRVVARFAIGDDFLETMTLAA
jgi:diaminohydroxyphosphoribosylaminopyrimidine deaminase/5-amino-6-(5-phosphoribosylamino)uracil reductase